MEALLIDIFPEALSIDILTDGPVSALKAASLDELLINKEKKSILDLI